MSANKQSDELETAELDSVEDTPEIDDFIEKMEQQDAKNNDDQPARRRIEELLEEKRLREQLDDDYPDMD